MSVCSQGWGWGERSYMRNVHAMNNSIDRPMVRLADGGGLYTNTPCPGCNVSRNVFSNEGTVYGCLCKSLKTRSSNFATSKSVI